MPSASGHDNCLGFSVSTAGHKHNHRPATTIDTTENTVSTTTSATAGTTGAGRDFIAQLRRRKSRIVPLLLDACAATVAGDWTRPTTDDTDTTAGTDTGQDQNETPSAAPGATPGAGEQMSTAEFLATHDQAEKIAKRLFADAHYARMCAKAWSKRGQLADLRPIVADPDGTNVLPDDVVEAIELLQLHQDALVAIQHEKREAIDAHITFLVSAQRSPTSFELPDLRTIDPRNPDQRAMWATRAYWMTTATAVLEDHRTARATAGSPYNASPVTVAALVAALADFFDPTGHGCTASTATIAERAITRHGATVSLATARRALRTLTTALDELGFLVLVAAGRRLTALEQLAARAHHGGHQTHAANRWDATLPTYARPATFAAPAVPTAPAYATGLTERLETRNTARATADTRSATEPAPEATDESDQESTVEPADSPVDNPAGQPVPCTYTVGTVFPTPNGSSGVAHAGARAPENTDFCPEEEKTRTDKTAAAPISLRAWRIADDLSRDGVDRGLDAGPYRHLVGHQPGQMSLTTLARMIDQLTPTTAGTREVLRGLVAAATSPTTGYVALGLSTRPRNAAAWMRTTLTRIDWTHHENFPAWSRTAEAYGLHWCGPRRAWNPVG
ncbi:hypothetical protein ACTXJM_14305 [Corynebacterium variabile]|uniref:hypothetical protein n=1 Tax=Corynebacterium variabile TaxID=1727 RepID=UPI003FD43B29